MTNKAIADIYYTYGKGDGAELSGRIIIDNTAEGRTEVFDEIYYDGSYDSKEDFINGEINVFSFDNYHFDWDDPTGGYIEVNTKEELINAARMKAENEIREVEYLFTKADKQ